MQKGGPPVRECTLARWTGGGGDTCVRPAFCELHSLCREASGMGALQYSCACLFNHISRTRQAAARQPGPDSAPHMATHACSARTRPLPLWIVAQTNACGSARQPLPRPRPPASCSFLLRSGFPSRTCVELVPVFESRSLFALYYSATGMIVR